MILILFGLAIGIITGYFIPFNYPESVSLYISISLIAAIDSLIGAIHANVENRYDNLTFFSGFITNTLLAGFFSYLGDRLGIPLYYAAILVFGSRIFNNISQIRHQLIDQFKHKKQISEMESKEK